MRKSRKNKKRKLKKYAVLILVLLFINIIWCYGLSITIATYAGPKPSIKPGEIYFYIKISREYVIRDIIRNNKVVTANIRVIVKDLSTNENLLNMSLLNLVCREGYYSKTIEKMIPLQNISTDKLYYVYLYDNITKTITPIGLPIKYNASLYSTINGGSFYKLDISYGLISKNIVIKNIDDSWKIFVKIITLNMENKKYLVLSNEIQSVKVIITPFYIKLWYYITIQNGVLVFELKKNSIIFNTRDNINLIILIDVLTIAILLFLVYVYPKKTR